MIRPLWNSNQRWHVCFFCKAQIVDACLPCTRAVSESRCLVCFWQALLACYVRYERRRLSFTSRNYFRNRRLSQSCNENTFFFFCFKISDYVDKRLSFEIVNRIRWAYQAQVFCTSRWSQPSQFSAKTTTFSKISTVTIAESKYVKAALQLLLQVYYYEATRR